MLETELPKRQSRVAGLAGRVRKRRVAATDAATSVVPIKWAIPDVDADLTIANHDKVVASAPVGFKHNEHLAETWVRRTIISAPRHYSAKMAAIALRRLLDEHTMLPSRVEELPSEVQAMIGAVAEQAASVTRDGEGFSRVGMEPYTTQDVTEYAEQTMMNVLLLSDKPALIERWTPLYTEETVRAVVRALCAVVAAPLPP